MWHEGRLCKGRLNKHRGWRYNNFPNFKEWRGGEGLTRRGDGGEGLIQTDRNEWNYGCFNKSVTLKVVFESWAVELNGRIILTNALYHPDAMIIPSPGDKMK